MKIKNGAIFWMALTGLCLSFISTNIMAAAAGDWLVRGRIINVSPNDDSDGDILGGNNSVSVDSATTIEVDFTYMVSPAFGLELILATTKHDVNGEGGLSGIGNIAEVGVLPPTLTAQYHFSPGQNVRPYAGAGINYTLFYDESISGATETAVGGPVDLDLDSSLGLALQAGVDIDINQDWFFNFDIKYIQIETEAELSGTVADKFDVEINPWVIGLGVGTTF